MTHKERLVRYINKSDTDGLQEFLQSLTYKERRKLVPTMRKLRDSYITQGAARLQSWQHFQNLLMFVRLTCLTKAEFSRDWTSWESFLFVYEEGLFDWYKPKWLSDFVNESVEGNFGMWAIPFEWIWRLEAEGIINPSPAFWAARLPMVLSTQSKDELEKSWQNLAQYPAVFEKQIWYLFEYENNLHFVDHREPAGTTEPLKANLWKYTFAKLIKEGKIDRLRVLRACINATSRMLSRNLIWWFVDLFEYLEPQIEEIRILQSELFGTFYGSESKPINVALKYLKKITKARDFALDDFLLQASPLFSHESKSIVRSALILLDKLARSHAMAHSQICQVAMQSLLLTDVNLQVRAAKLLVRYADKEDESIKNELALYQDQLMGEARLLLAELIDFDEFALAEEDFSEFLPDLLAEEQKIELPQTVDDFVFVLSQYIDSDESEATDILLASCHYWVPKLRGEDISKLAPALKQIIPQVQIGNGIKYLAGVFILGCLLPLAKTYPQQGRDLLALYKKHFGRYDTISRGSQLLERQDLRNRNKSPIFQIYVFYFRRILLAIEEADQLPILSTPSHAPCYLDPAVLVDRLAQYELAKRKLPTIDLQIALCRTVLDAASPELIESLPKHFQGERLRLLTFLLDPTAKAVGPFSLPQLWQLAAACKYGKVDMPSLLDQEQGNLAPEAWTADYNWYIETKVLNQNYPFPSFGNNETKPFKRLVIECDPPLVEPEVNPLKRLWQFASELIGLSKKSFNLYEHLKIPEHKGGFWWNRPFDVDEIRHYYSLVPHQPEPLLAQLIRGVFSLAYEKPPERMVQALLEVLHHYPKPLGPMGHLLLGLSLLAPNAHNRLEAIEVVLQKLDHQLLDPQHLGYVIGKIESQNYAPFKRFTDALNARLPELVQRHATAMANCLTRMLVQFQPQQLPKNPKKLLEIYLEFLRASKESIAQPELGKHLRRFKSRKSLQKLVAKIEEQLTSV
ncbi:MAG: DUF6493 family protein [Bacteroidota bacterium]